MLGSPIFREQPSTQVRHDLSTEVSPIFDGYGVKLILIRRCGKESGERYT
jgi:hypothetical protein